MSRWCKVELVIAPTEEGGKPTTLETSAHVLERAALFRAMLKKGKAVIPITSDFEAGDVALFLQLAAVACVSADAASDLERLKRCSTGGQVLGGLKLSQLPLTVELIERVAPFCVFCGAHELLGELVLWVQCNASARAVRCIEGLAGGTFKVEWGEAALQALFAEASIPASRNRHLDHEDWGRHIVYHEVYGLSCAHVITQSLS